MQFAFIAYQVEGYLNRYIKTRVLLPRINLLLPRIRFFKKTKRGLKFILCMILEDKNIYLNVLLTDQKFHCLVVFTS